jgi:hypothetical protein
MQKFQSIAKRLWLSACVAMLPLGILDVWRPLASDVSVDLMWFIAMALLTFPSGLIAGVLFWGGLWATEQMLLGEGWHFSTYAFVCLTWSVMSFFGYRQWFDPRLSDWTHTKFRIVLSKISGRSPNTNRDKPL